MPPWTLKDKPRGLVSLHRTAAPDGEGNDGSGAPEPVYTAEEGTAVPVPAARAPVDIAHQHRAPDPAASAPAYSQAPGLSCRATSWPRTH